jgi:ectoine hydroxylase
VESAHAQRMEALDRDGFVAIPGALGPEAVRRLTAVVDRTYDRRAASGRLAADGSLHLLGFVSRDPAFRQLVDLADPLALVAGVLGWNIYL